MKIANSYNKIASSYDENADTFSLLTNSRFSALRQIQAQLNVSDQPMDILDLGAGSGVFIAELSEAFGNAHFTALDISREMLQLAKERLPTLKTIEATVSQVNDYLHGSLFDVIVAHFVLAYVSLDKLIKHALPLLKPDGILSVVTTTHESFPFFQECMWEKAKQKGPIGSIIKRIRKNGMQKTCTPYSYNDIQQVAEDNDMKVVGHQQISTEILFDDATAMMDFAIRGGWLLNAEVPFLPTKAFYHIARLYFSRAFQFPLRDHHIVEVVLLRR